MGKILVIDDEDGLRAIISRLLQEAGYETITAAGLREGIALLAQYPCDLVYCDVRLRHEFGMELLPAIRQMSNPPLVIIMTGYPSLDTAQQALRQGAFDYLTKPILGDDLLRSASRALGSKHLQDEKERLRLHLDAVLNSVDEGLLSVSPDLILRSANQAAQKICGISAEDMQHPFIKATQHCQGGCLSLLQKTMTDRQKHSIPRLVCHRQEQGELVASITTTPLLDGQGKMIGAVIAIKDETRLALLEKTLESRRQFHRLVGQSQSMQKIYHLIEDLAEVESTVLINGESGTGKELVAEAIHEAGHRVQHPLVKVNCVALSETLLESELFGHVRGAFTGAMRDRVGRIQEAHRGTLFLDEIGDISPSLQVRLLRVLQEKTIQRVGDNRTTLVDVRIVAATHRNLQELVARGLFREDLYWRLKVVDIFIPPLRERKEDIPLLVEHAIAYFNNRFSRRCPGISEKAMVMLMEYNWPGNVRELNHVIEHAFVLCHEEAIDLCHLPERLQGIANPAPSAITAALASEKDTILQALAATRWNRDQAARRLGWSRSTFFRRLKQLGIERGDG
ncbi:MAG: sigma 54-interacting transcriptional regulator [Magnetococcales bacterium]|nr:sigma 54-interacting transcriptional regulator [Magnetococcales bacterium]NGZ28732.1 sigma 54-interacting transcriptional regulator [Magnetococcales bacterium]